jgi:hypothetical protein
MITETKLRPLINYDHQPESMEPTTENKERLRDIG